MKESLLTAAAIVGIIAASSFAHAAEWQPSRPLGFIPSADVG
jgi:hypothetical protein